MKKSIYKTSAFISTKEWEIWKKDYISYLIESEDMAEEEAKKHAEDNENKFYEWVNDEVNFSYDCDLDNLNKELGNDIIILARVGRWNGTVTGYKEVKRRNLNEILKVHSGCDDVHVYVENRNIYAEGIHHDGRNFAAVRMWKDNVSDEARERLLTAVYNQDSTAWDKVMKHTKSLYPYVKEIFG